MKRAFLSSILMFALIAPAGAKPFVCPHVGGDLVFGQEANTDTLDQMSSSTISTRNIAMNIYESLMTRDENNHPILELASTMTETPDRLTYTFKLRPGVVFHNNKKMTSADVAASFDRYAKIGGERAILDNVKGWDAPDPETFVIRMKVAQPTFIEALSSFSTPIVIIPAESRDVPARQLTAPIGTGPFQLIEFVPGDHVKLKRHDGYQPNTAFEDRTGLGGYKQACLDTVTFRFVIDQGARVAGLKTGELQAVEDLPTKSLPDLRKDPNIAILPVRDWWIQIATPNASTPPTDNLTFRRAVQAALDMDEIMNAASDGDYHLNVGFQYPNQPDYTDAGKETYNIKDAALAKQLLGESGYKGEPVILLTNKDYPPMYNSALVMQQQMQAVGINAQMNVVDWPTSVRMARDADSGWNFFFTGWGTPPALGALATMQLFADPNAVYRPKDDKGDPDLLAAWNDMNRLPDANDRQAAFARMQRIILDNVYAIPFGTFTKVQGVRTTVQGFAPFRIPRWSNVWFSN